MSNDIIIDTLDTLIALLQRNGGVLLPQHRGEAERIARAAWGGERPYVVKVGESEQRAISERDRAIRREFQRGAHVPLLARRHGLSERRVRAILQFEREEPAPAESTAQASVPQPAAADCLTDGRASGEATRSPKARQPRVQGVPTST